jgi:hypothetical protein
LILCSRNDRYQGDSVWRLGIALNSTAEAVRSTGRELDVEIVLVDWGSTVPLREALHLTPAAAACVQFLYVSQEIIAEVSGDSKYAEVLALNAAAKRAKGTFVGRIDQDTVMNANFVSQLFDILERRTPLPVAPEQAMFLSNRRQIPYRFASRSPSLWCTLQFVRLFGPRLPIMFPQPPETFYQSYVGIWLLHRDLWNIARGLDEQMIYMNWMEVDMYLRLQPKFTLVNLGELVGHSLYHLDHVHPFHGWHWRDVNRKTNPRRDFAHLPPSNEPNDQDWGLARYQLPLEFAARTSHDTDERVRHDLKPAPIQLAFLVLLTGLHTAIDAVRLGVLEVHQAQWPIFALRNTFWKSIRSMSNQIVGAFRFRHRPK